MHENKCARCGKWYRRGAFEGGNMCPQCRQGDESRLVEFERSIPWEKGGGMPEKRAELPLTGENRYKTGPLKTVLVAKLDTVGFPPSLTIPECGT